MRYDKKVDPFYKSTAWKRLRLAALERDHYICQDCLRAKQNGERIRPRTATAVHHILPREQYPEKALEIENLISLCDACHNKRHPEKGGNPEAKAELGAPINGVRIIKV